MTSKILIKSANNANKKQGTILPNVKQKLKDRLIVGQSRESSRRQVRNKSKPKFRIIPPRKL